MILRYKQREHQAEEKGLRRHKEEETATAATKEILSFSRDSSLEELSDFASGKFAECMLGEEAKEGLAAFAEKRKPYWYGA